MKYLINQQDVINTLSFDEANINLTDLGNIISNFFGGLFKLISKLFGKGGTVDIMKQPTINNIDRVKALGNQSISPTKQEFIIVNSTCADYAKSLIDQRVNETRKIIDFVAKDTEDDEIYWANKIKTYETKAKANPSRIKQEIWKKVGVKANYNEEQNTYSFETKEYIFNNAQDAVKFSEERLDIIISISDRITSCLRDLMDIKNNVERLANDTMKIYADRFTNKGVYIKTVVKDMIDTLTTISNAMLDIEKTLNTQINALMINILKWFNPQDKHGNVKVEESAIFQEAKYINDKGNKVPKICPKCGSPVEIYLRGEPVFCCSNKKCNKCFGVVPFKGSSIYQELSFNESDQIILNEGLLEIVGKIFSTIINFFKKLLGINTEKKKGLLNKLNIFKKNKAEGKTKNKKTIFNLIKVNSSSKEPKMPILDNAVMLVAAIKDAVASGNPVTMQSVMAKYGENTINIQGKEILEDLIDGFKMEDTHIVQDERGEWNISFGKAKIEVSDDNVESIVTSRIPILDSINSGYKDKLEKINKLQGGLDIAVKMTDDSKYPGGFVDWMNRQLNRVNEAFTTVGNKGQIVHNSIWKEIDSVLNNIITIEKVDNTVSTTESNIFDILDLV